VVPAEKDQRIWKLYYYSVTPPLFVTLKQFPLKDNYDRFSVFENYVQ